MTLTNRDVGTISQLALDEGRPGDPNHRADDKRLLRLIEQQGVTVRLQTASRTVDGEDIDQILDEVSAVQFNDADREFLRIRLNAQAAHFGSSAHAATLRAIAERL